MKLGGNGLPVARQGPVQTLHHLLGGESWRWEGAWEKPPHAKAQANPIIAKAEKARG